MSETEVRDGGFSVTTTIKATPDAVFDAWTTKAGAERWLATTAEIDARVGGTYEFRWPSPQGELSARGDYVELVPGRKIVFTWESWGPDGRIEDGDTTVEVDLDDLGDGSTAMTQTESGPSYGDRRKIDMSMAGTIQAHEALRKVLESR